MEIELDLIQKALHILTAAAEPTLGSTAAMEADFYWSVDPASALDPYERPELTLGSLSDACAELELLVSGKADPVPHHLVWVGDVLRALGATVSAIDLNSRGGD